MIVTDTKTIKNKDIFWAGNAEQVSIYDFGVFGDTLKAVKNATKQDTPEGLIIGIIGEDDPVFKSSDGKCYKYFYRTSKSQEVVIDTADVLIRNLVHNCRKDSSWNWLKEKGKEVYSQILSFDKENNTVVILNSSTVALETVKIAELEKRFCFVDGKELKIIVPGNFSVDITVF